MNKRFARIAATTLATGALLLGDGIAATAAYADSPAMSMGNLYQSAGTTVNPQITDSVTSSAPTSSGHDRNEVRNPTMRDLDRILRSDPVIRQ